MERRADAGDSAGIDFLKGKGSELEMKFNYIIDWHKTFYKNK